MEQATFGTLHAGDVVQGADRQEWGVQLIGMVGERFTVTLVRHGEQVTGWPVPSEPVLVVRRCDTSAEARAFDILLGAGLDPAIIGETWEST